MTETLPRGSKIYLDWEPYAPKFFNNEFQVVNDVNGVNLLHVFSLTAQFNEGAIPAAEYVETRTDVLEARLTLQRHRAELSQAQARYLTTLGLVPRSDDRGGA